MENVNSVAYINKINTITPIAGADNIELATVNGWTSVVQKGIHTEGDLVLCITTDAVIPLALAIQWKVDGYLRSRRSDVHDILGPVQCVRTVKLRGAYSECILIPTSDLSMATYNEGRCLMQTLKIRKYEPPVVIQTIPGTGRKFKYRQNSNFHIYYKFPNQKNVPDMFRDQDMVSITRKLHGTNARYGIVKKSKLSILDKIKKFLGNQWAEYEYVYGSHNVEKGSDSQGFYSTDVWKEIADKYEIKKNLWNVVKTYADPNMLGAGLIVYGEIYGPGIQGDKYSYMVSEKRFAGFDIEMNSQYLNDTFCTVYMKHLNLQLVPLLYCGPWTKEKQDSFVFNQFIEGTKVPHEGIVVKSLSGDRQKVSKVINPDYHTYSEKNNVPDSH